MMDSHMRTELVIDALQMPRSRATGRRRG